MKAPSGSKTFRKLENENTKLKQQKSVLTKEIERVIYCFHDLVDMSYDGIGIDPLLRSWVDVNVICLQESLDSAKEKEDNG